MFVARTDLGLAKDINLNLNLNLLQVPVAYVSIIFVAAFDPVSSV